jgi:hypothetical protein
MIRDSWQPPRLVVQRSDTPDAAALQPPTNRVHLDGKQLSFSLQNSLTAEVAGPDRAPVLSRSTTIVALAVLGIVMRLPGIFVTAMYDVDEILLQWGAGVSAHGVGGAYRGIYGVFAYALAGAAYQLGELMPRFWNAPYKVVEILFEVGVVLVLWRIVPPRHRIAVLWMFWTNPWFALHGAWQGFWDGPHTMMALLAVYVLKVHEGHAAWLQVGLLLGIGTFIKPQGLVFFVIPMTAYLLMRLILFGENAVYPMLLGVLIVLLIAIGLGAVSGGTILMVPQSYIQLTSIMPNLSNESLNIWRTITSLIQWATGQSGRSYTLVLGRYTYSLLHLIASSITVLGIVTVCLWGCVKRSVPQWDAVQRRLIPLGRLSGKLALAASIVGLLRRSETNLILNRYSPAWAGILGMGFLAGFAGSFFSERIAPPATAMLRRIYAIAQSHRPQSDGEPFAEAHIVLLVLALCSILIPQFNTRMHINHAYAGLVLLIPLAAANRRVFKYWLALVGIHFYAHLLAYEFGRAVILPSLSRGYGAFPDAQDLIAKLEVLQKTASASPLIQTQALMNRVTHQLLTFGGMLERDTIDSVLSAFAFVTVLALLRHFMLQASTARESTG